MKFIKSYLFLSLFLISAIGYSQTEITQDTVESNTLEAQFQRLKNESNDYQVYKVVKKVELDRFWKVVEDTLQLYKAEIENSNSKITELTTEVDQLQQEVSRLDSNLTDQEFAIHNLSFMGTDMTKSSYKTLSWIVVGILILLLIIIFIRFKSANRITQKTKLAYTDLENEFEEHRRRTREKETDIKRELQTAVNTLQELNQKPSKK